MNDFKDCYQSAVKDMNMLGMKEFHIDASSCMDERRHSRWVIRQMRRTMTTAFSAVCVVFLCGFGTVKAAEYIGNVIKVNEWGFESADAATAATMARNEAAGGSPYIISEEVELTEENENVEIEAADADTAAADAAAMQDSVSSRENSGLASAEVTAAGEPAENILDDESEIELMKQKKASEETEIQEVSVNNYASLAEFEENEDIIFPQPLLNMEDGVEVTSVTVCGDWAMARYDADGKVIWVERTDYAGTSGHASSKVFPGGICNERQYTTAQGYTYTLVDSVKENEDEQLQIHGAVTVGTYEAYVDFIGYTEEEAVRIIESIDLSEYE